MIVSIAQPAYLPWLGYFDRIVKSDLHIVLDHVQYEKRGMTNRNKLRTREGWMWVSVPIRTKGRFDGGLAINRLEIEDDNRWARKHWQAIQYNYAKTPNYGGHSEFFERLYAERWPLLAPIAAATTAYLLECLNIRTQIAYSSNLAPRATKADLIIELCRKVGASVYISGPLGRDYLEQEMFEAANIELLYHDYQHPVYRQAFEGFEPYMSAVDLIFNHGAESMEILENGPESLSRE